MGAVKNYYHDEICAADDADDPSVMDAAANLVAAGERFDRRVAETDAQAAEWEARRVAAMRAFFERMEAAR